MKIKLVLVFIIICILVFYIYVSFKDSSVYYLSINDYDNSIYDKNISNKLNKKEMFINEFSSDTLRITDVINSINDNNEIIKNNKKISIQHALIKADLLTLMLGNNELKYIMDKEDINKYDYVNNVINDYDTLIGIIKKYCKEDIFIIGHLGSDNISKYYNKKLKDLSKKYDIKYVDISYEDNNLDKTYKNISDFILKSVAIK